MNQLFRLKKYTSEKMYKSLVQVHVHMLKLCLKAQHTDITKNHYLHKGLKEQTSYTLIYMFCVDCTSESFT